MASTQSDPKPSTQPDLIPLSEPEIRGNEWKYVKECLDTNWVSSGGSFVTRFERMIADYVGAKHAVATINGTSALHAALLVAGVQPDDEVLVSSLTFIAPVNVVRYCGAWPVFMDADPTYWQMDAQKVVDFLERECRPQAGVLYDTATRRRIKAILPVHILGHPVDMDPILEVARKYDLVVVEDGTESLGAKYKGRMVGLLGDIGCYSFNGNKTITCGGGGMLVTNNEAMARRARYLTTQARDDDVEYVHHEVGYNYRLTNLAAAVGVAQVEMLGDYIRVKRTLAAHYASGFKGLEGVIVPREAEWAWSTFWLYTLLLDPKRARVDRHAMQRTLTARNIQSRPLWCPIHEQRPYRECRAYHVDVTPKVYEQALSLPSSVGLSAVAQKRVIGEVRKLVGSNRAE